MRVGERNGHIKIGQMLLYNVSERVEQSRRTDLLASTTDLLDNIHQSHQAKWFMHEAILY